MLKNNNSDIDIEELNKRITTHVTQFRSSHARLAPISKDVHKRPRQAERVETVTELLALDDKPFVEQAYKLILNRPVDPSGLEHRLNLLRQGVEKTDIVNVLCLSEEGRPRAHLFPAGRWYSIKASLLKLPLVGRLFGTFFTVLTIGAFRRHINARFNFFAQQGNESDARIFDLEQQVGVLIKHQEAQRSQWDKYCNQLHDEITKQKQQIERLETSRFKA